jgi:hypothetical protein
MDLLMEICNEDKDIKETVKEVFNDTIINFLQEESVFSIPAGILLSLRSVPQNRIL